VAAPAARVAAPATPAVPARGAAIAVAHLAGEQFAFDINVPGRYEIGRAAAAALRIDHTTVSRRHAAVSLSEDRQQLRVEDLGAANGTRVNGVQVKGTQDLRDGDVLELGEVRLAITFDRG
jgi:predicted component of type VI protein secretion system